ncbi:MAG: SH3 domain-containing protein [Lachnospiraceae bacterium]|nr:SH3 domain-containing protein [Lachnospiraceae bacterium]
MKNRICCVTLALMVSMATACANFQVSGTYDLNGAGGPIAAESSPIVNLVENNDIKNVDDNKDNVNEDRESEKLKENDPDNSANANENGSAETETANDDKQDSGKEDDGPFIEDFEITATQGEMVVVKNAVVRKGPSTDFAKLGTLTIGDVVELTGESTNGWYRFKYDSEEGFTFQKFLINKETYDKEHSEEAEDLITGKNEAGENAKNTGAPENAADSEDAVSDVNEDYNLFTDRVIEICNEKRAELGLDPLTVDIVLDEKAEIRAEEITRKFDHKRPDGSEFTSMLSDVTWSACGENIAAGQPTPEDVVEAWMNSYGHRANILNPSFSKIGVGYISGGEYGNYWVQIFTD